MGNGVRGGGRGSFNGKQTKKDAGKNEKKKMEGSCWDEVSASRGVPRRAGGKDHRGDQGRGVNSGVVKKGEVSGKKEKNPKWREGRR